MADQLDDMTEDEILQRAKKLQYSESRPDEAQKLYEHILTSPRFSSDQKDLASFHRGKITDQTFSRDNGQQSTASDAVVAPTSDGDKLNEKFSTLRTFASFLKVLAILNIIGGLLGGLSTMASGAGLLISFSIILSATFSFAICFAAAETLEVLPDIEENTRRAAKLLKEKLE